MKLCVEGKRWKGWFRLTTHALTAIRKSLPHGRNGDAHEQTAIPGLHGPCDSRRVTGWVWVGRELVVAPPGLRLRGYRTPVCFADLRPHATRPMGVTRDVGLKTRGDIWYLRQILHWTICHERKIAGVRYPIWLEYDGPFALPPRRHSSLSVRHALPHQHLRRRRLHHHREQQRTAHGGHHLQDAGVDRAGCHYRRDRLPDRWRLHQLRDNTPRRMEFSISETLSPNCPQLAAPCCISAPSAADWGAAKSLIGLWWARCVVVL